MTDAPLERLAERLAAARDATLALVRGLDDDALAAQPHAGFSPVGWHLGHVAFTEAYWLHGRCGGDDRLWKPFVRDYSQGGRPKRDRRDLPRRADLLGYLARVRERTVRHLGDIDASPGARDPLQRDGYAVWLVECHEHQHRETMSMVLGMAGNVDHDRTEPDRLHADGAAPPLVDDGDPLMVRVPGGEFGVGTDEWLAYDNERRRHPAHCDDFQLDAHPVTTAAWLRFMEDGGYDDRRLWCGDGWRWRQEQGVSHPLGWRLREDGWVRRRLDGATPLDGREPVCGVSWYEADAFARWRGTRLPTETEWERAAALHAGTRGSDRRALDLRTAGPRPVAAPDPVDAADGEGALSDLLGNVWEWTESAFGPYPGFEPFPYRGYSAPYFGGHRVLRGGSFATSPVIARPSFRNWYHPHVREVFAGLRCAKDG